MKLHQLRYLAAVAQTGLNITAAAEKLHTSQPGVSKQIKLLEDELGFQIFVRDGRNLTRVTPAGQQVIDRAVKILREVQNIKRLSDDLKDEERGSLSIATTHTQAQPRGFAISPSGRWLIAAGQLSNAVNVHAIDTATGHLTLCHEHAVGRNPNWVEAIALP